MNTKIKKYALASLAALVSLVTWAQSSGEIPIEFSDPGKRGKLIVDIRKGNIKVTGTSRKNVILKYTTHADKDCDDCNETRPDGLKKINSAAADLEVSEQNNVIKVDTDWSSRGINLVIEVPVDIDLVLEPYSGDVEVNNIKGELELDGYNGQIVANNISGSVIADTYNGKIVVSFDAIDADTPMAFSTYNGDVDLTLPSSFRGDLKMRTARGEILSGFDIEMVKTDPIKRENKGGVQKVYLDEWVRGRVNGGGPEFMIKNYNGDIYLRKK